jgi:hypothetical protein
MTQPNSPADPTPDAAAAARSQRSWPAPATPPQAGPFPPIPGIAAGHDPRGGAMFGGGAPPPWQPPSAYPAYPTEPVPGPPAPSRPHWWGRHRPALAVVAAGVVAAASVGITLAVDHHGAQPAAAAPAKTSPASRPSPGPAGAGVAAGAHAAGSGLIGEPSTAALVSSYTTVINKAHADDLTRLLCGGTGMFADTAPEWSYAFLALNEQIAAAPVAATSDGGATSTLTVTYQHTKAGVYGLIMAQHAGRWCVSAVNNGSLGPAGLGLGGGK